MEGGTEGGRVGWEAEEETETDRDREGERETETYTKWDAAEDQETLLGHHM